MSCEVVVPYVKALLSTEIVEGVQADFASKVYLDKIFPLAFVGEQKKKDVTHKFPRVYLNDGGNKYIDVMPDKKLKGFMFFEIVGLENFNNAQDEVTMTFNTIFWFNLRKIDDKGYDYKEELLTDVLKTFKNGFLSNDIVNMNVEENFENIYDRYTLPQTDKQFFMYPYSGFKLTYTVTRCLDLDCLDDFTITNSPSDCP